MKEEQARLLKHYLNLANTGSGMIAKNAKLHADEIIKNYPGIMDSVKEIEKAEKEAAIKEKKEAAKSDSST